MTSRAQPSPPVSLILVRHARPEVHPDREASCWELSADGREAARALGDGLRRFGPLRIVTSDEKKAIQTGEAMLPGGTVTTDPRFGEQGCGTVPFLPEDAFRERVLDHFRVAQDRVLGDESSAEAVVRFDAAVQDIWGPGGDEGVPVIVSHGRIISAWLATHAGPEQGQVQAADIWMALQMPDAFRLTRGASGWTFVRIDRDFRTGR